MSGLTPGVALTLGPYSLAIARPYVALHDRRIVFLDGNEDTGVVEYSAAGTGIVKGSKTKFQWTMRAWLTADQWRVLQAIYQYQRRLEGQRSSFGVLLDDQIREVVDPGPRVRAMVPGTMETPVGAEGVAYFARFLVRVGAPTASPVQNPGFPWLVDWQMAKVERVQPEGMVG